MKLYHFIFSIFIFIALISESKSQLLGNNFKPLTYDYKSSYYECHIADFEKDNNIDVYVPRKVERCGFGQTTTEAGFIDSRHQLRINTKYYEEVRQRLAYYQLNTLLKKSDDEILSDKKVVDKIKCYATILNSSKFLANEISTTNLVTDILRKIYTLNLFNSDDEFGYIFKDTLKSFSNTGKGFEIENAYEPKYVRFLYSLENFEKYDPIHTATFVRNVFKLLPNHPDIISQKNLNVLLKHYGDHHYKDHDLYRFLLYNVDNFLFHPYIKKISQEKYKFSKGFFYTFYSEYENGIKQILMSRNYPEDEKCNIIDNLARSADYPEYFSIDPNDTIQKVVSLKLECIERNKAKIMTLDRSTDEFRDRWCPSGWCNERYRTEKWKKEKLSCDSVKDCKVTKTSCGYFHSNKSISKKEIDTVELLCTEGKGYKDIVTENYTAPSCKSNLCQL